MYSFKEVKQAALDKILDVHAKEVEQYTKRDTQEAVLGYLEGI